MAKTYLLKNRALCDDCYQEELDYLAGREEVPKKVEVYAKECDKCHALIEPEEEL